MSAASKQRPKVTRKPWSEEDKKLMREKFPHMRTADLAAIMGRKEANVASMAYRMNIHKSEAFLASSESGRWRDGEAGKATRFKPGHNTWNTGMKGLRLGGQATQFKRGTVPPNHRPVGSTRINVDGYTEIKVAEDNFQWRHLHREVWKEHHGEYPPKGYALVFRDGNKQNCAIDNLELIPRGELMKRNTIHRYPPELKQVIKLAAKVRRKLDDHDQHE